MVTADIYDLFNDVFFEVIRFVLMLALIVLAIFLGAKLRKLHDKKAAMKEQMSNAESDTTKEVQED